MSDTDDTSDHRTLAVLGTGIMGGAMARRWAGAGWTVTAWNRDRAKAEALADAGVAVADSPAEAVRGAAVVVTMLADADVTADVAQAFLPAAGADALWVQMGTVGVAGTERLAGLAADAGLAFLDAPVSGTKQPAEQGKLMVLASGPSELRERSGPVFDPVAAKVVWVGDVGAGSRLKLVLNGWLASLLAGLAESIALAEGLGLDPQQFLDAIDGGPLGPAYASMKGAMMLERSYPAAFPLRHLAKDVDLVAAAAEDAGVELQLPAAVARLLDAARPEHDDDDMAAVVEGLR